jgi:hypothetical protein
VHGRVEASDFATLEHVYRNSLEVKSMLLLVLGYSIATIAELLDVREDEVPRLLT